MKQNLVNDTFLGRDLPYSLEAEQTILGALLLDPQVLPTVMEHIRPESFYKEQHREIFNIILRMFANGQATDILTVMNEAVAMGVFETTAMAKTYLKGIMENVPSVSNIKSYCKIVEDKYYTRALINASQEIIEMAAEGSTEANVLLDSAEQKIYDIRQGNDAKGLSRIDEVVIEVYDRLQKITGPDKDKFLGAKSGFTDLDAIITGLNDTDLLIIAARPGMGKTSFALNIATNVARKSSKQVVLFSLEMGKEQLVSRMLSSESLVNSYSLRMGRLSPDDWTKLALGAEALSKLPIYMDDSGGISVPAMKAKLRRMKNLGLVVIDYLQLMEGSKKNSSRVNEVSEITRQLKLMAKELKVPVITLSQLNRGAESRTDHRPLLSDLRESGSIEQDADVILFLYREGYYDKENNDQSISECIISKNRHGETGTVKLCWNGEFTLFRNIEGYRNEE